ncbi:outer membrane protein assembly factor BamB family protein [Streptomyces paludis]|uniref:Pyrrolo-quinoline quinone repeat domain-containing protein n=1 Tax=Streptomyces paludis TaxID=2282738 RepID=A0A345HSP3_9ACTN|nr:PQQ-binding-like beta-propeller repeat protein [Streptomyces paludis]AXG79717.1 hypothetical protein DVK44_21000 [Streptomyces paludis]
MTQPPQPPNQPPTPPSQPPNQPPAPAGRPAEPSQPTTPPAPPTPPQQPPGPAPAGFGAPQEPPAGGFGAPQDPPPAGYGYPGQQPPVPPPGYGYPAQQPPYQQGHPPYQQQGYQQPHQYPQYQQQYPQHPQGFQQFQQPATAVSGGKPGKSNTRLQIVIAAAVAVVLIIGAGVWFANSGGSKKDEAKNSSSGATGDTKDGDKDGDKGGTGGGGSEQAPSNTKAKVAFTVPLPKVTDSTSVYGSWLSDSTYVKTGIDQIVGYDLTKGTQLWAIPLPGEICATTKHVSKDYRTAIAFAAEKPSEANKYPRCTKIAVIDLKSGEMVWNKSLKDTNDGERDYSFGEITLSGETVAVGGFDGGAAFNIKTGAVRWKPEVSTDGCYDTGYGGGEALVAVRKCGSTNDPQMTIQSLNPLTGAPLSAYTMPSGVDYPHIVSTKPLVVAADVGDTAEGGNGFSDLFSIDEKTGKLLAKISAVGKFEARCGSTDVEKCSLMVVGDGKIYVPTAEHEGSSDYGRTNEIIGFDLTTGKGVTGRADAGERRQMYPVRMDGSNVIVYKTPTYDKGGEIISVDGSTFKQTLLLENSGERSATEQENDFSTPSSMELLYRDGRMFISSPFISKPNEYSKKRYLAMSFTTKQ